VTIVFTHTFQFGGLQRFGHLRETGLTKQAQHPLQLHEFLLKADGAIIPLFLPSLTGGAPTLGFMPFGTMLLMRSITAA
jgi:hypothetical protein